MTGAIFSLLLVVLFAVGLYVGVAMGLGALVLATVFSDRAIR